MKLNILKTMEDYFNISLIWNSLGPDSYFGVNRRFNLMNLLAKIFREEYRLMDLRQIS